MPDTDTASPVDTQLLTHRAVRSAGQPPGRSWRDVLPIHPAADLFPRMSRNELQALADDIRSNGIQNQIVVISERIGETGAWSYFLIDGISRLDAIELAGFNTIAASRSLGRAERRRDGRECGLDVFLGLRDGEIAIKYISPPDDPYAYVASVNIYRRHLTADQKRELIENLLKATPEKSDRQIAETVKASQTPGGMVRAELAPTVQSGQLPEKRVGKDGKARRQPSKKGGIGRPQPANSKPKKVATSFNALVWWSAATSEARSHFIDSVGLKPRLAAIPSSWQRETEQAIGPVSSRATTLLKLALGTNSDGEALAALAAMKRVLAAGHYDLRDLELHLNNCRRFGRAA